MWQRRYGFPAPLRDTFGDRVYPADQVARLKLIKQLLSEGWRAGAVVPLADSALQSMVGLAVAEPAPLPAEISQAVRLLGDHRVGEMQNHLSKLLVGQGLRKFLEQTLIPLNEAVHERVVRGEMQTYQELRFADLAQRLLRDVTRLVRPTRDARQILLATPPNDPNQLGLAILELLLFTEGINCLTLGTGVPAQEIASATEAYHASLVVLLFDRGISGKIAGQEIRCLRRALPEQVPLIVTVIPFLEPDTVQFSVFEEPNEILKEFGKQLSIPVVFLITEFRKWPAKQLFFELDGHWNALGNSVAAETMDRELRSLNLLPSVLYN